VGSGCIITEETDLIPNISLVCFLGLVIRRVVTGRSSESGNEVTNGTLESGGVNESMPLETQQQKGVFNIDSTAVFHVPLLGLRVNDGVDSKPGGKRVRG